MMDGSERQSTNPSPGRNRGTKRPTGSVAKGGMLPGALRAEQSASGLLVYRKRRPPAAIKRSVGVRPDEPMFSLNTICPYYTMFPLAFPFQRLAKAAASEWVLDPFCGRGTTVFAARLRGLGCVGIDSNPIAAAIAAAKLTDTTAEAVITFAGRVLRRARCDVEVPDGTFWRMGFHRSTLRDICLIRKRLLESCSSDEEVALRALMLGILHGPMHKSVPTYLTNQMPRTQPTKPAAAVHFGKEHRQTRPRAVGVLDAIARRARHTFNASPPAVRGEVHLGDSRSAHTFLSPTRQFSWVITSPPYFGMRTYRPDQWLRNWFLGGSADVNYDQTGQLSHHSERFADELAAVWRAIARRCVPDARLIVRFGYLPSIPVDARNLLRASFARAAAGWRIRGWLDAGSSSNGKRQSEQFGQCTQAAACEIDVYARLEV